MIELAPLRCFWGQCWSEQVRCAGWGGREYRIQDRLRLWISEEVRTLREGVAQIRQAIEIAVMQTKDKHAIAEDSEESGAGSVES